MPLSSTLARVHTSGHVSWAVCGCITLAVFAASGGQAVAQSDGVFVDPDSPAGKEYALPLEEARREAAPPGQGSDGAKDSDNPLFGAGIARRGSSKTAAGDERGAPAGAVPGEAGNKGRGRAESTAAAVVAAQGSENLSAGVLTGLVALGVLSIGGAVGLVARSRRRRDQTA